MKIQVLWVPPRERRFGSGSIMTTDELSAFGYDPDEMLSCGEAQLLEPRRNRKK